MGHTKFIDIKWQQGTLKNGGQNGATIEDVVQMVIARLEDLQEEVPCGENIQAIVLLRGALASLERRTEDRKARGVEGTEMP